VHGGDKVSAPSDLAVPPLLVPIVGTAIPQLATLAAPLVPRSADVGTPLVLPALDLSAPLVRPTDTPQKTEVKL
jgi:hypothetical protein